MIVQFSCPEYFQLTILINLKFFLKQVWLSKRVHFPCLQINQLHPRENSHPIKNIMENHMKSNYDVLSRTCPQERIADYCRCYRCGPAELGFPSPGNLLPASWDYMKYDVLSQLVKMSFCQCCQAFRFLCCSVILKFRRSFLGFMWVTFKESVEHWLFQAPSYI